MPAAYPLALRQRAVTYYRENDCTQDEVAEIFNIGITTLRVYLRRAELRELAPKDYKRGRQTHIAGNRLQRVISWVEQVPDIKIKTLCNKYKSYYKKRVSQSMMCRALSAAKLTRKNKNLFTQEQLRDDVNKKEITHEEI